MGGRCETKRRRCSPSRLVHRMARRATPALRCRQLRLKLAISSTRMLVGPPILPGPPFGLLSIWVVPAKKDRAPGPAPGLKRPPLPSGLARNQRDRRVPRSVDAPRFLFARIFSLQALIQLHAGEIATLLVDILRAQLLPTVFPGCIRHLGAGAPF